MGTNMSPTSSMVTTKASAVRPVKRRTATSVAGTGDHESATRSFRVRLRRAIRRSTTTSESMRTACAISSTNGTGIPSASPPYIDAEKKARADLLMLCVWWP